MKKVKNVRLPAHFRPTRYAVEFAPDLTTHVFDGREVVHFTLSKSEKSVTLHALELRITSAEVLMGTVQQQARKISYNTKSETVTFYFKKLLRKGKGTLTLAFSGVLNDKMRGFYKSNYTVDGVPHALATTQFESTYARYAFPCVDEPSVKAVFDVTLVVPKNHVAISNTLPIQTAPHSDTHHRVTFSPSPLMSTYLLAFVVGKFEWLEEKTKSGVLVRVFVTPGKKHEAEFALGVAVKSLEFFEKYFKIKYPLPVLDNIAIPDFSAGAMENWGAITYRETAILYNPEKSSAANKQRVALVIAHEIAHQWFGNLVTMDWWTDLWLNEGFATYIEYLAVDSIFPSWDVWTQFVFVEQSQAFSLDALQTTHAIEIPVHHPSEIKEIFDAVSYAKGASVIRMLANYLGEKDFREGLHQYLKKHAYKNTVTNDLWKAFERVSGKPVRRIMSCWTRGAGYPVVDVVEKSPGLVLKQSRFYSSRIESKKAKTSIVWNIPMMHRDAKGKLSSLLLTAKEAHIKKQPLILNAGASGFFRTNYSSGMLGALEAAIRSKKLTPRERLIMQNDAFALAEAGRTSLTSALELACAYKNEHDYSVWASLLNNVGKVAGLLEGSAVEVQYNALVRELLKNIADKVGWAARTTESHTDKLLRSQILLAYGSAGDRATIARAKKFFAEAIKGKVLDSDLRTAVYYLTAKNGGEREYRAFVRMYERESSHIEKNRILQSMGAFKKPVLVKRALQYALSSQVRFQDTRWIFMTAWASNSGARVAWEMTKKHWPTLVDRYATAGHDLARFVGWAGTLKTTKALRDVRQFFKAHKAPGAQRAVQQALESIESNSAWLAADTQVVVAWLKNR